MHFESMIDDILSLIRDTEYSLHKFSLVCSESALKTRLQKDFDSGVREKGDSYDSFMEKSLSRLLSITNMSGTQIDVSDVTPEQAAREVYNHIYHR